MGIIIAAILGILLLFLIILLCVPFQYEIAARCEGTMDSLKIKAKITWLLHLVCAEAFYTDQCWKRRVRIAWKRLGKKSVQQEKKSSKPKETEREDTTSKTDQSKREAQPAKPESKETESVKSNAVKPEPVKEKPKKKPLFERILSKWKCTKKWIRELGDKWKHLQEKKEKLEIFLLKEEHKKAFGKGKKEVLFLLRKWKPKKLNLRMRFGFEDPSITGQVLAALAMLYPLYGDCICIDPEFEERILKGSMDMRGKLRLSHLAGSLIRVMVSKAVRITYQDVKEFDL